MSQPGVSVPPEIWELIAGNLAVNALVYTRLALVQKTAYSVFLSKKYWVYLNPYHGQYTNQHFLDRISLLLPEHQTILYKRWKQSADGNLYRLNKSELESLPVDAVDVILPLFSEVMLGRSGLQMAIDGETVLGLRLKWSFLKHDPDFMRCARQLSSFL